MEVERFDSPSPLGGSEAQVSGEAGAAPATLPGASPRDIPASGGVPATPAVQHSVTSSIPASSTIPWDQTWEFLASSDWTIHLGAPTEYNPPRATGKGRPADVTSFHPAEDNLPDILYTYKPPLDWLDFYEKTSKYRQLPPPKTDAGGNIMYERWPTDASKPHPLLNFSHLPDQIGTKEAWWAYEAWRRYDPRIRSALPRKIKGAGVSKGRRGEPKSEKKKERDLDDTNQEKQGEGNDTSDVTSAPTPSSPPPKRRGTTTRIPPPTPLRGAYTLPPSEEMTFLGLQYINAPIPIQSPTPSSTRFGPHPASEEGQYTNPYQYPPAPSATAGPYSYQYPPAALLTPYHSTPYPTTGYPGPPPFHRQTMHQYPSLMPLPRPTQLSFAQHGVDGGLRRGYGSASLAVSSSGPPPPPPRFIPRSSSRGAATSQVPALRAIRYDALVHPSLSPPPPPMDAERDWMEDFVDLDGMDSPSSTHTGFPSPPTPIQDGYLSTTPFSPPTSPSTWYQPQEPATSNYTSTQPLSTNTPIRPTSFLSPHHHVLASAIQLSSQQRLINKEAITPIRRRSRIRVNRDAELGLLFSVLV
ncbi:MAG: hypothetical protein Q9184_004859 [Pyrenodesmia sp. 2 TL-2023]